MYRTEIYGKKVIYTNECIIYGDLDIFYNEMSDIQHLDGDRRAFRFIYKGKVIEIPYLEGERDIVMPYYRMAAQMSPEVDPIENDNRNATGNTAGHNGSDNVNNSTGGFSGYNNGYRTFEKNVFTWVFCFLLGGFGVDRFVRGQIGLGLCKLLLGWATLGIWALVDWIIAMVKAYGAAFGNESDFVFDENGRYIR